MNRSLISPELLPVFDKVAAAERISEGDALALFASRNLHALAAMATLVRERKNGDAATYLLNRYVNYSNVCLLRCQFCAYRARRGDSHAFELDLDKIVLTVREALAKGITEIHMVGGLHPTLPAEWYLEVLRRLKGLEKEGGTRLHLKCFSAIEALHLSRRIFRKPLAETLGLLREAGLDSLTGGGAEILDDTVRDQLCRGKESAAEWLEVHRVWHRMGGRSTCTMLFGHIETHAQRVAHLRQLRELQDETGGFTGFVPFAFSPEKTDLLQTRPHLRPAGGVDILKTLAVSRIYLDNIDHLTAYWISMGLPLAQVALQFGVDDLHGTIMEEKVFHMAGAQTPQAQTVAALERVIREAGRTPIQRGSHYERIAA